MSVEIDRDGAELTALFGATEFRGTRVLEVGCGDGRLTRRYAHLPALVVGLEPDPQRLSAAARNSGSVESLRFVQAPAVPLRFRAEHSTLRSSAGRYDACRRRAWAMLCAKRTGCSFLPHAD